MSTVYLKPRNQIADLDKLEFMYTPQIEYSQDVKYTNYSLPHTNYQPYAYSNTENPSIGLSCKFTSQTIDHFLYCEKAIRFLRTYTKMNYGRLDNDRGQPPRILRFFGLGQGLFNDVPVVISKFNMTFPEDCDYVEGEIVGANKLKDNKVRDVSKPTNISPSDPVKGNSQIPTIDVVGAASDSGYKLYLPIVFTISITLLVQQNLSRTVNTFALDDFGTGYLGMQGYI